MMNDCIDDHLSDGRLPYKAMRSWLLDCYYTYCRSKIKAKIRWGKGWLPNEHEIHWAYEQYELSFHTPIEQLMLEVLTLILNGGRDPDTVELYHRAKIAAILEKHDLDEMLKTLEGEELSEFEDDMKLLKLV
jgi:hypothetical protein